MGAYQSMKVSDQEEIQEARLGTSKTFKSMEDWVMAVVNAGGSVVKRGNNLSASGLGRTQSATFELKKGRGSMVESVETDESLEEAKMPSKDQINKVLGPTKNSEEGIKAIMKQFGCDRATAEKCLDSVMEGLEEKKLDPVDDKENDKKFKDRKDKDIDNDGDVDSSDEYLHKKRAATDDAIDGGDKPAKDDMKKNPKTADKKAEISKIESVDTRSAFEKMWTEFAESIEAQKKGSTKPEEIDSKESPKSKEFAKKHSVEVNNDDEEGHDMASKAAKSTKQAPKN